MEMLQLGPFIMNRQLAAAFLALGAGYAATVLAIRRTRWRRTPMPDVILGGLLIGFLVWKALPSLRNPSLLWPNPLKALLVQGGAMDSGVGAASGLAYVLAVSLVRGIPLRVLADVAVCGSAAFLAVRGLAGGWKPGALTGLPWGISLSDPALRYHPVNIYETVLGLILLAVFSSVWVRAGDGRTEDGQAGALLVPLLGAGLLAVSLFARHDETWLLLAPMQWFGAVLLVAGLFLPRLYILWEAAQERRGWHLAKGDSKEKRKQARNNARDASPSPEQPGFDKKLDGPNRPAE